MKVLSPSTQHISETIAYSIIHDFNHQLVPSIVCIEGWKGPFSSLHFSDFCVKSNGERIGLFRINLLGRLGDVKTALATEQNMQVSAKVCVEELMFLSSVAARARPDPLQSRRRRRGAVLNAKCKIIGRKDSLPSLDQNFLP